MNIINKIKWPLLTPVVGYDFFNSKIPHKNDTIKIRKKYQKKGGKKKLQSIQTSQYWSGGTRDLDG